jgi:hypothetical protein
MVSNPIKIQFTDFYNIPNAEENYLYKYLKQYFNLELSDDPDVVMYSNYGFEHKQYKCLRILFCAEYAIPNIEDCDYCFSQHHAAYWGKNYRLPMYVFWKNFGLDYDQLLKPKNFDQIKAKKTNFCSFVVSSPLGSKKRVNFMQKLSNYKQVDSGGRLLNNINGCVTDKMQFLENYKFNISFANGIASGYADEKIVEPMFANSIPIFWGNPQIDKDFNPESFINCHDYHNEESVIQEIKRVDQDDELYRAYLQQPWFHNNCLNKYVQIKPLIERFSYIFSQIGKIKPVARSKRRYLFKLLKLFRTLTPIVHQTGDYTGI